MPKRRNGKPGKTAMAQPLAADDSCITIDTPISELRVTPAGRKALTDRPPDIPPEALDLLSAVASWEDNYGTVGHSADEPPA